MAGEAVSRPPKGNAPFSCHHGNSVKRSDVTGNHLNENSVKTKLYKTPPQYFIVVASSVTTMEVKAIELHRIILTINYRDVAAPGECYGN